jgi:hypothetical protein
MSESKFVCAICNKPLKLDGKISVDEDGKPVHTNCYVMRVVARKPDPPSPEHPE